MIEWGVELREDNH